MQILSWLENIRYCIATGVPSLYAGAAGEGLKAKLGAHLEPTAVVLKLHNPLLNTVVNRHADTLSYESDVPVPRVVL